MRTSISKPVALGLLALSLGFSASSAFAGNVEECEFLKDGYTKGLYGLCIAWHNAGSDNARDRILDKYEDKAGPGDPPMPGTDDEIPCPCWGETELLDAACNRTLDEAGPGFAIFDANLVQFFNYGSDCVYSNFNTGATVIEATDSEQSLSCEAELVALVAGDLDEFCP
jgi:hypothetical protein